MICLAALILPVDVLQPQPNNRAAGGFDAAIAILAWEALRWRLFRAMYCARNGNWNGPTLIVLSALRPSNNSI